MLNSTVYYTVSFTCNMYFLNSTYFIFNQFMCKIFRVSFAVDYILSCVTIICLCMCFYVGRKCEMLVHCIMPFTKDSGDRMVVATECSI